MITKQQRDRWVGMIKELRAKGDSLFIYGGPAFEKEMCDAVLAMEERIQDLENENKVLLFEQSLELGSF